MGLSLVEVLETTVGWFSNNVRESSPFPTHIWNTNCNEPIRGGVICYRPIGIKGKGWSHALQSSRSIRTSTKETDTCFSNLLKFCVSPPDLLYVKCTYCSSAVSAMTRGGRRLRACVIGHSFVRRLRETIAHKAGRDDVRAALMILTRTFLAP